MNKNITLKPNKERFFEIKKISLSASNKKFKDIYYETAFPSVFNYFKLKKLVS